MIGNKIDNYRITSVLGEGGMGVVYKAFDLKLERYVALKILNDQAVINPQFVERFKREAKNQAQLSHPNIVPVYGFTDDNNLLGFVMEYVNGETLEHRISARGRLELLETLEIMKQILAGAAYAHSKGYIHRDLKPSNIIFTQEGIAKIMDFGISKSIYEQKGITRSGVKIGTLLYMSPEQIKAQEPTQQSDIYALGIIFYEILAGKNPFDGNSDFNIMEAHLKKYPPRLNSLLPEISEETDRIIFKAIAKSTEKRYKDAFEFYEDVDQEIIRLKSEERKTREILITKEFRKNTSIKIGNYLLAISGILIALLIIYFVYNSVSGYFINNKVKESDDLSVIYNSNPFKLISEWEKINIPLSESLTAIEFRGSNGLICGLNGALLYTKDSGNTWNIINYSNPVNFYSITPLNNDVFLITGAEGHIFKFILSSKSLIKINISTKESLFDSYFFDDQKTGFICGGKGLILKTSDSGNTWFEVKSLSSNLLYAISFSDSMNGVAVGWDGEILNTNDGGTSWSGQNKITSSYLRDINFLDENTGIICGGEGTILKTTDKGKNWKKIDSGISSGLYFVSFINPINGYILSSRGEILYSEDAGERWQTIQSGSYVSLTNISVSNNNRLFITGYNGTVLASKIK